MSLDWEIMDRTMRKIYTITHTSQFLTTDAFKLQISAHKKYALSGHFSLATSQKIKATVELIFYS